MTRLHGSGRAGLAALSVAAVALAVAISPAAASADATPPTDGLTSGPWHKGLAVDATTIGAVHQTKLLSPESAAFGNFGDSVAVDGDTAVIGERNGDGTAPGSGAAWVYVKTAGLWALQAKLTVPGLQILDQFGSGVAISGDTIIVGAPGVRTQGSPVQFGAAYVFVRSGTTWTQQAALSTVDGLNGIDIGYGDSVAIDGDTAVVGAYLLSRTPAVEHAGAAYVYVRSGATWTLQERLHSDDGVHDFFGSDVAIDSDTIAVGAYRDNSETGDRVGAVYMFARTGSSWLQQAKLFAAQQEKSGYFGFDVDVDADTMIAGSLDDDHADVFVRSGTTWRPEATLTAPVSEAGDYFGSAVALDGDTALVGAQGARTGGGPASGSTYAFLRSGSAWTARAKIVAADGSTADEFGSVVGYDGTTAVVAAPGVGAPDGGDLAGAVYIVSR